MPAAEVLCHFLHRAPSDTRMATDILDESLQHQQHLWAPRNIRMDGQREDRVVAFAVDPVEPVTPQLLDIPRI